MKDFKAGAIISKGTYKYFQPETINRSWIIDDMELLSLLSQADRQLGRLDMYSEYIPNIDLFIQMHVVKEATLSSKIEGTHTSIEDALLKKEVRVMGLWTLLGCSVSRGSFHDPNVFLKS